MEEGKHVHRRTMTLRLNQMAENLLKPEFQVVLLQIYFICKLPNSDKVVYGLDTRAVRNL